ncbi:MAG: peptidylprolyl isomerase [Desulfovibrionaceae bacterium]
MPKPSAPIRMLSRALSAGLASCLTLICLLLTPALAQTPAAAPAPAAADTTVRVQLQTNLGNIIMELYPDKAPVTVANFLEYAKAGFYDGTIFHRVVPGFVIQGGGYTEALLRKPVRESIKNEADNGLRNDVYTVAMARGPHPNSADAQFYINLKRNAGLDFRAPTMDGYGYCVFGKVYAGAGLVDRIGKVATKAQGPEFANLPVEPVVIKKVVVLP